jgi:hypothetical protein
MDFNKLVFDKLGLIFNKYNLHIKEQFKNYIKLESDKVVLTVGYFEQESSSYLFVGGKEKPLYPIDENVFRNVFKSELEINNLSAEDFINKLKIFFEKEGIPLITGDEEILTALERYVYNESKDYTSKLVEMQNIDAANRAWERGNYEEFIKYFDKLNRLKLPSSFELKYKWANQKLKN